MRNDNLAFAANYYDESVWQLPREATEATLANPYWQNMRIEERLPQRQVMAPSEGAAWISPVRKQFTALARLQTNWDSYGAPKVNVDSIQHMATVLQLIMRPNTPAPIIVPTSDGKLQAEWHQNGIDFEIEVISPAKIMAVYEDTLGEEWERPFDYDFSEVSAVILALTPRA